MSYHQAHLAWQQRVNIEKHQNRKTLDTLYDGSALPSSSKGDLHDQYSSVFMNQLKSDLAKQVPANKAAYTFGGSSRLENEDKKS